MEYHDCGDGLPRARPSNISVPCNYCGNDMPYDPSNPDGVCVACNNHMMAFNTPEGTNSYMSPMTPGPRFTQRTPSNLGSSLLMTPPASIRQQSFIFSGQSPFGGRLPSNGYTHNSTPLIRRSIMGPAARMDTTMMVSNENEDDDEFVDAQEEIRSEPDSESVAADEASEDDSETLEDQRAREAANEKAMRELEEEDLFESTFGKKVAEDSDGDDDDQHEKNGEKVIEVAEEVKSSDKGKASTAGGTGSYREFLKSEHRKGCKQTRRMSTPPDTGLPPPPPAGPKAPDPIADLSHNSKWLKNFHNRAVQFIPRLPLATHRYWIGVLNLDVKPKYFNSEKHFTWMKGNRFTTVETVWNMYQQTTATEDFVLLLGFEKVEDRDRVEELDYFNCKKVMFRAVYKSHPDAGGRELCAGVIPQVQEVAKQKKIMSTEVIEIDDD